MELELKKKEEEDNGEFSVAIEARDIAAILDGFAAEEAEPAVHAAGFAGSAAEQPAVQLRAAVVAGSDTAWGRRERQRGRGERGARRAGELGRDDAAAVHGV